MDKKGRKVFKYSTINIMQKKIVFKVPVMLIQEKDTIVRANC